MCLASFSVAEALRCYNCPGKFLSPPNCATECCIEICTACDKCRTVFRKSPVKQSSYSCRNDCVEDEVNKCCTSDLCNKPPGDCPMPPPCDFSGGAKSGPVVCPLTVLSGTKNDSVVCPSALQPQMKNGSVVCLSAAHSGMKPGDERVKDSVACLFLMLLTVLVACM